MCLFLRQPPADRAGTAQGGGPPRSPPRPAGAGSGRCSSPQARDGRTGGRMTQPTTAAARPEHQSIRATVSTKRLVLIMAGVLLGMLLGALDQTIVGTALPRIIAEFNGIQHYAWVVTAYMLASTVMVPKSTQDWNHLTW